MKYVELSCHLFILHCLIEVINDDEFTLLYDECAPQYSRLPILGPTAIINSKTNSFLLQVILYIIVALDNSNHVSQYIINQKKQCIAVQNISFILKQPGCNLCPFLHCTVTC